MLQVTGNGSVSSPVNKAATYSPDAQDSAIRQRNGTRTHQETNVIAPKRKDPGFPAPFPSQARRGIFTRAARDLFR